METGRADAGTGLFLSGNGKGQFKPFTIQESGFYAQGDVKDLALLTKTQGYGRMTVIVANNNGEAQAFLTQKITN